MNAEHFDRENPVTLHLLADMQQKDESFIGQQPYTGLIDAVRKTRTSVVTGSGTIDRLTLIKEQKDITPEGKLQRRKKMIRAIYGEFIGTFIFFTPLFGFLAHGHNDSWPSYVLSPFAAFVSGFQALCVTIAFSEMSGANCNCAISFALWLTGGLSNRKVVMYIVVQLIASIVAMGVVAMCFSDESGRMFEAVAVQPVSGASSARVFASEFFLTFILTYLAFTVVFEEAQRMKKEKVAVTSFHDNDGLTLYASTPQSKSGFAPFAIGFIVFSLSLFGGSSNVAMNPVRMLGPAIFSGVWDRFYIYTIAEFLGAGTASLLVTHLHKYGLEPNLT